MNTTYISMEQQVTDYLIATEQTMPLYKAPDRQDIIWQRHQSQKLTKASALVASLCVFSFALWFSLANPLSGRPDLIAQNQALELQLAQLSVRTLSEDQQIIMTNWQHELELIDQNLEQERDRVLSQNLWAVRNQLLTQMINFYQQPIDLYEI